MHRYRSPQSFDATLLTRHDRRILLATSPPTESTMAVSTLEAKAHELLSHLGPSKLAAVVQLLEAMVHDEDESDMLSPAEAKAIAEADEWSKHNEPIPH